MSEQERPKTQTEAFQQALSKWMKDFGKKPWAIPIVVAVSCGVFYLSVEYLGAFCLSYMIAPLFMLGMLWWINVKRVRRLLVIGAVATLFFGIILAVVLVDTLQHTDPVEAKSMDNTTGFGTLSPLSGGSTTIFHYNLTITLTNDSRSVDTVNILIFKLGQSTGKEYNYTMTFVSNDTHTDAVSNITTRHYNYSYDTTLSTPINQYLFRIEISGGWISVGDISTSGKVFFIQGPIYADSWAVAAPLLPSAIQYSYIYIFLPYAIILGMIWWTRRARRMRTEQMERWEKERTKEEAEKPKVESKVPSLAKAMGKGEETFVCSECGADVPADATVCPKCGEKFE